MSPLTGSCGSRVPLEGAQRKRGGHSAACLGVWWARFACWIDFTHFSVKIDQAGLGDGFNFQGKKPWVPILRGRSGHKCPCLCQLYWDGNPPEREADHFASQPVPLRSNWGRTGGLCRAFGCCLSALRGSVSCPSDARFEPLSWPPSCGARWGSIWSPAKSVVRTALRSGASAGLWWLRSADRSRLLHPVLI